jgi:hypothetical protein
MHVVFAIFWFEALERQKELFVEVLVTHQFNHGATPLHGHEP